MSNNLFTSDADGVTRPATEAEILDTARAMLARRIRRGRALGNPRHTREYLQLELAPTTTKCSRSSSSTTATA